MNDIFDENKCTLKAMSDYVIENYKGMYLLSKDYFIIRCIC